MKGKEGSAGEDYFPRLFPAVSISGESLVPQIGVELSKWPLTTRPGVEDEGTKTRGLETAIAGLDLEGKEGGEGRVDADTAVGPGSISPPTSGYEMPWSSNSSTPLRECTTTNLGLSLRNSREKEERAKGDGEERDEGVKERSELSRISNRVSAHNPTPNHCVQGDALA